MDAVEAPVPPLATGITVPVARDVTTSTTLNTLMAVGETRTVTFLSTQGTTAYYSNTVTVDGTSVVPKWQSGSTPTAGNVSSIDVYTYSIIKTASATFTVLASQTQFK